MMLSNNLSLDDKILIEDAMIKHVLLPSIEAVSRTAERIILI